MLDNTQTGIDESQQKSDQIMKIEQLLSKFGSYEVLDNNKEK